MSSWMIGSIAWFSAPAAERSIAYQSDTLAVCTTACATVQSRSGMRADQSASTTLRKNREHCSAVARTSLPFIERSFVHGVVQRARRVDVLVDHVQHHLAGRLDAVE